MIFIIEKATVIENIGGAISDGLHYVHMIVLGTVISFFLFFCEKILFITAVRRFWQMGELCWCGKTLFWCICSYCKRSWRCSDLTNTGRHKLLPRKMFSHFLNFWLFWVWDDWNRKLFCSCFIYCLASGVSFFPLDDSNQHSRYNHWFHRWYH